MKRRNPNKIKKRAWKKLMKKTTVWIFENKAQINFRDFDQKPGHNIIWQGTMKIERESK